MAKPPAPPTTNKGEMTTMDSEKLNRSATTDGQPPRPGFENASAPAPTDPATGQHKAYWILSDAERAKGFIRPVRRSYKHLTCGTKTTMGEKIAETYAADPKFYGATFCCCCGGHFPVGENGEFVWWGTDEKVGT